MTNPYSLTQASVGIHGLTNYVLPVFSSYNASYSVANLWVFDSNDNGCEISPFGWGCIYDNQVAWYNEKSKEVKQQYGTSSHHLAFFHIPLPQWKHLYNDGSYYGNRYEPICCPIIDTGLISEIEKNGDISGIFCGHDHDNDYGGFVGNIEIAYGRKTGYGGYGPPPEFGRGARVIQLTEYLDANNEVQVNRSHWIIHEDLSLETNKTYHTREESEYQYVCGLEDNSPIFYYVGGGLVAVVVLVFLAYKIIVDF